MLDDQAEPRATAPLFSVIIPLEYHRGQWERCWQGWQSQTLDRSAFEIILVVPPNFPDGDKLRKLAGAACLEYSDHLHDIALCATGAARARGQFLFFTESHCWPEPDVLELCLRALRADDRAAFSCKSVRVSHNRLSEAEADMYEAETEYGMTVHPWRKILDICFVTRREAYEESGGFRPELGHFAEWALAASYFERGQKIGYLPEARVHHYYIGSLAELKAFTLDFVNGEASYFSNDPREPGNNPLEIPPELACRGNFDRGMAQAVLGMIVRDILSSDGADGRRKQNIFTLPRWASPAIFGDGLARSAAAAVRFHAYLVVKLAPMVSSRERLGAHFRRYIAALIRYQRLKCIRTERLNRAAGAPIAAIASGVKALVLDRTGFYPLEKYQGSQFRWSETAAAIRLQADAGRQSIRIKCLPVRKLSDEIDVRFYVDGKRIPDHAISTGADDFEIQIDLPRSGTCKLGWICRPFEAIADPRRLGLPVTAVELISQAGQRDRDRRQVAVVSSKKPV